jgi:hypothetical protein
MSDVLLMSAAGKGCGFDTLISVQAIYYLCESPITVSRAKLENPVDVPFRDNEVAHAPLTRQGDSLPLRHL